MVNWDFIIGEKFLALPGAGRGHKGGGEGRSSEF